MNANAPGTIAASGVSISGAWPMSVPSDFANPHAFIASAKQVAVTIRLTIVVKP